MPTASLSLVLPPDAPEEAIARIIAKMQLKCFDSGIHCKHQPEHKLSASLTLLKLSSYENQVWYIQTFFIIMNSIIAGHITHMHQKLHCRAWKMHFQTFEIGT
jgi:hypothetical protein